MNIANIRESARDFHILQTTSRLQTATMLLQHGEETSDKLEVHPDSDQMVLLLEGELIAVVGAEKQPLGTGQSLIVPAGTPHRFYNATDATAVAITVYGPPAYPDGE